MATVTSSKRFSLNWQDAWKGIKMAVILPVLVIIQQSIEKGEFSFDWKLIGLTAVGGFIAYLIKNFFAPAEIIIKDPPKDQVDAVAKGEATAKVVKNV